VLTQIATIKNYNLFETRFGTFKITHNGTTVANPATEEQAWERIKQLAGTTTITPQCWNTCRIHNCVDCERYY
jgi:hypothetical protein